MRRVLHVPACDLREGDLVSFWDDEYKWIYSPEDREQTVLESRPSEDNDGQWYLEFTHSEPTQFCSPAKQFVLIQELP